MRRFLDSQSVGSPQFIAAALLLVYLLECAWLVHIQTIRHQLPDTGHALRIYPGLEQWKGKAIAGTPDLDRGATGVSPVMPREASPERSRRDARLSARSLGHSRVRDGFDLDRSPFYYLTAAAPELLAPAALSFDSTLGQLWATAPYFFFAVMLGGSLWYVARRLYGNAGGYIALTLYCFSPAMIVNAGGAQSVGEMGAAWGAFGTIFTAIAVAHTLYAPREVVLWNWRRIVLLSLSFFLIVGNQFSLAIIALAALLLMFWVAPVRRGAVIAIWITAAALATILLYASYFGASTWFFNSLRRAIWIEFEPRAFIASISYVHVFGEIFRGSPPLLILLSVALITYFGWKRTRYFGNTAPLLIAALLLVLAVAAPLFPGQGFHLTALTFLFVFVAGIVADLLETRNGALVKAGVTGLLTAAAVWNLLQLFRS